MPKKHAKEKETDDLLAELLEEHGSDDVRQSLKANTPVLDILNSGVMGKEEVVTLLNAISEYHSLRDELQTTVRFVQRAFPEIFGEDKKNYTLKKFRTDFVGGRYFRHVEPLSPAPIALVELHEFFGDKERFERVDPTKLPNHEMLEYPYEQPEPDYITLSLGKHSPSVPMKGDLWLIDKKSNKPFIIGYEQAPNAVVIMTIEALEGIREPLVDEIKEKVETSRYFRGQVIEVTAGAMRITKDFDNDRPIIDKTLQEEIEKNIINLFRKRQEIEHYGLPSKRTVLLAGRPGNGKTMVCRWLANMLRGEVTTLWASSKSIHSPYDIEQIFYFARKMSPALLIIEDIDLIVGSRTRDPETLGEMLQQLDGLNRNDQLVVVASTNRVFSLDEALRSRPGRIDRIYQLNNPNERQAEVIARSFLAKHNVPLDVIDTLGLPHVKSSNLTGAQIVSIMEGAIFEAIHRNCPINDLCISTAHKNIMEQREKFSSKSKK